MRALVGALIGLVVGAAIVAALGENAYWSVVLAGLVAGLSMRFFTGVSGFPYAKGALAAIATALAAIGGPVAATQWRSAATPVATLDDAKVVAEAEDETEGAATDDAADLEPMPEMAMDEGLGPLSTVNLKRPSADTKSMKDIACLVIGCLLAYQMGKGSEAKPANEDEPPADDPTDPGDQPAVPEDAGDAGEE
ncbi:hypothetical protein MalM25_08950 [Planctomycetes bacterium MalM25]|nr:hypothetical protein MalM25_08950 [Planctomycetes bacterium MalM25]